MAAKRGLLKRIRFGWRIGLAQGDHFVRIGTLVIVAQLGLLGYLFWTDVNAPPPPKSKPGLARSQFAPSTGPASPSTGNRGWITPATAELYPAPAPKPGPQVRKLLPYTPLSILGRSPDGRWLRVQATLPNGLQTAGWVAVQQVQTVDPAVTARPEPGWVTPSVRPGAALRPGPDARAGVYGVAPAGQVLRQVARLRRSGSAGDFLLVEVPGHGLVWVLAAQVAPARAPAGATQKPAR